MPKRLDINKILVIGSGPIQIGQGCEFDYSGTQACRALKEEGYEVVLINSNPATIMTDPDTADAVYIEPITIDFVRKVIEKEKPDAVLPTMGGQAGLNILMEMHEAGDIQKYGIRIIGVQPETVHQAEDREAFKHVLEKLGYDCAKGDFVHTKEEANQLLDDLNLKFPVIIRAAYTLGGTGGGIAYTQDEFEEIVEKGIEASPINELLIEESILGWKEYELEVMQDSANNFVVVCGVENINPVGVHTGDSITVAPCMTLTDKEYQTLRDIAKDIFKEIGMETGGANIQFAIHPDTGRVIVIEMNPRVSRSSALVSKATGYPIARISAQLAVGYTLDELKNEITGFTPAAFEPMIDYVAVKIPRWDFEKFPTSDQNLGVQMKSVGEVLAFGRTFKDAFNKAWRSLENGMTGWEYSNSDQQIEELLKRPTVQLFGWIKRAFEEGYSVEKLYERTKIGRFFLHQMNYIFNLEQQLKQSKPLEIDLLKEAKKQGLSNIEIAKYTEKTEDEIDKLLQENGITPTFKMVDTCAAEFEAKTPYYFKTYEQANDNRVSSKKKVVIIGSGPNRIGQGIEFDYSCVHAVKSFQEEGFEVIMINCNPETVSTDYNTSDKLYVEPLTKEDVIDILRQENPDGVVIQFGGQTPLKLAKDIERAGFNILGTDFSTVELAENREEFGKILNELQINAPAFGTAFKEDEAVRVANDVGYPVLVRPSYVLGGRGMKVVHTDGALKKYIQKSTQISKEAPVLIDKFLENAQEFDVDAISDGTECFIPSIMQHIEQAGIHSGDSSCVIPPFGLSSKNRDEMLRITKSLAQRLNIRGLMNVQYAVFNDNVYMIEVNPRSSRTVPFISKATGIPLAKLAAKIGAGKKLKDLDLPTVFRHKVVAVKAPVFPFKKFDNVVPFLGPEMRSIGEVMGRSKHFGNAYAKALIGAGYKLPKRGNVLVTVNENDKMDIIPIVRDLYEMDFDIIATEGTAKELLANGIQCKVVYKLTESDRYTRTIDIVERGDVALIINTPYGAQARKDEEKLGQLAIKLGIPFITTLTGAHAISRAIQSIKLENFSVDAI